LNLKEQIKFKENEVKYETADIYEKCSILKELNEGWELKYAEQLRNEKSKFDIKLNEK